MGDTESRFTVSVDAKGLDQTKKKLERLEAAGAAAGQGAAKGFAAATSNIDKMASSVDKLVARMDRLAKTVSRVTHVTGKAGQQAGFVPSGSQFAGTAPPRQPKTPKVKEEKPDLRPQWLKSVEDRIESDKKADYLASMRQKYADYQSSDSTSSSRKFFNRHAGNFGLGMFQSAIPGTMGFLQRGPGAVAQGLGVMAGNAIGGLASIPFAGAGGLSRAMGSLGPLALPFDRFMGRAESAMSMQRQQLELAPLLGSSAVDLEGGLKQWDIDDQVRQAAARGEDVGDAKYRLDALRRKRIESAVGRASKAPLMLMGTGVQEGQAFVSQLAQAGGNRADQMTDKFIYSAMAAKTAYGLDAGTSGAFALAARTNAVAGGGGKSSSDLLMDALGQVKSLGLTGADAQNYLQKIAEGIRQFQVSGMPLQMDSMRNLTAGFTGLGGMTPLAAQHAASGMLSAMGTFHDQGPQSGFDLMMMQKSNFKGGLHSFLKTQREMTTGKGSADIYSKALMASLPAVAMGGDIESAYKETEDVFKKQGISSNPLIAQQYVDDVRGGKNPTAAFNNLVADAKKNAPETPVNLASVAQALVPDSVTASAAASNRAVVMGSQASGLVQELNSLADQTAGVFSRFSLTLKLLVDGVELGVDKLGDIFKGGDSSGVRPSN